MNTFASPTLTALRGVPAASRVALIVLTLLSLLCQVTCLAASVVVLVTELVTRASDQASAALLRAVGPGGVPAESGTRP